MTLTSYPQIESLKQLIDNHQVAVTVSDTEFLNGNKDYPAVVLHFGAKSFNLFVDDEYRDLKLKNPELTLCLVLRELEDYEYAGDYLEWCKHHFFEPENISVRNYHMSLGNSYTEVEKIVGKIESYISDYDFELNAGAARALRERKNGDG